LLTFLPRLPASLFLTCFAALLPEARAQEPLDRAFQRLYSFDFKGAHRIVDKEITEEPAEPLNLAVRAAALLFEEFDRLRILESEFFADDKRMIEKKGLKPDPAIRARFLTAVKEGQRLAALRLASNASDADSLFTMALSTGLMADYTAMIEKRQRNSLTFFKQSNEYALRLLRAHPNFIDAHLTTGFTEYLIGSLPFFLRWFVKIDGVEGSKSAAAAKLQRVAQSGRYLKPFAKILLSVFYLREKQPGNSARLLAELAREFPENPLIRKEHKKVALLVNQAQ